MMMGRSRYALGGNVKERTKQLIYLAAMVLFTGSVLCGFQYIGKQRSEAARIETEKAKQVSIIPPATEEAWQAFIDRRVALVLRREGRLVKLDDETHRNVLKTSSYVSVNAPYQITCTLHTASIQFGTGGDDSGGVNEGAEIYNTYLQGSSALYDADRAPPISVPQESIAAASLRDHVCQHLANMVQTAFSDGDNQNKF